MPLFVLSKLLSSLWVSSTGSASVWCALQEALYKCIATIQYNKRKLNRLRTSTVTHSLLPNPVFPLESKKRLYILTPWPKDFGHSSSLLMTITHKMFGRFGIFMDIRTAILELTDAIPSAGDDVVDIHILVKLCV